MFVFPCVCVSPQAEHFFTQNDKYRSTFLHFKIRVNGILYGPLYPDVLAVAFINLHAAWQRAKINENTDKV